jgi:hypothetical protein
MLKVPFCNFLKAAAAVAGDCFNRRHVSSSNCTRAYRARWDGHLPPGAGQQLRLEGAGWQLLLDFGATICPSRPAFNLFDSLSVSVWLSPV